MELKTVHLLYFFPGEIKERGLVLPFTKEIYKPMLKKLELEGITERREVESEDL